MADRADLVIYQGDDYAAVVTVSAPGVDPTAVILGYTAKAQIRYASLEPSPDAVAELGTVVNSPLITLSLGRAVTGTLKGDYVWDLQITAPDGVVTTILNGEARVGQEVTR